MNRIVRKLGLMVLALCLGACSTLTPQDYRSESPKLDLREYFNGKVDGWGMVQDRSGKVLRRMVVEIDCKWAGNDGTLDERFVWSDGKTEKRIWKIRKDGDRYVGTAGDVIGEATGEAAGNSLRWNYVLSLPVGDSTYAMNMDDWMWQIDERTLANRTRMSKFGVDVAEISIFFRRR
jgi:hypothetical protein